MWEECEERVKVKLNKERERERGGAIQKPSKRMKAKWVYTRSCQTHGSSLDSVLLKFKKLLPKCRAAHLRVWALRRPLQSRLPTALGLQTSSLNTPQIHFTFTSPEGKTPPFLPLSTPTAPTRLSPSAQRRQLSFIMKQPYVLYIVLVSVVHISDTRSVFMTWIHLFSFSFSCSDCKLTYFYIL